MIRAAAARVLGFLIAWTAAAQEPVLTLRVTLPQGELAGAPDREDIAVFRGIPYAAPPVGALRWRPPQAPAAWEGVRAARDYGPLCPQRAAQGRGLPMGLERPRSEDCLTLNVWTAGLRGAPRPVLVWIHGGGFSLGSGAIDGAALAREDLVFVSLNYRLGPLGIFAHPALAGENPGEPKVNYALMDMIAALRWVRAHIAAFGGDPAQVTVLGDSAGGMAVDLLMTSPAARGLFQRAIAMSGYPSLPLPRLATPHADNLAELARGEAIARQAGAPGDADAAALRALDAIALVEAKDAAILVRPAVDGDLVTAEPARIFAAGGAQKLPFLSGITSFEGAIVGLTGLAPDAIARTFGASLPRLERLYAEEFGLDRGQGMARLFGDYRYGVGTRMAARAHAASGAPAYLYLFDQQPPGLRGRTPGAAHGSDVAYLLGAPESIQDAEDRATSEIQRRYWLNFARSGDPNGPGLPHWPRYGESGDVWLVFRAGATLEHGLFAARFDALEEFLAPAARR